MNIVYKTGSLLSATESVIVHGCNAKGIMGKGVALDIKTRYPEAYQEYRYIYEQHGLRLGQTIWVKCNPHTVVNAITQDDFRVDPRSHSIHVDYDAVAAAFHEINATCRMTQLTEQARAAHGSKIDSIALPLIGAGLAGGSWKKLSQIIEKECNDVQPVVYLLDGKVPTT